MAKPGNQTHEIALRREQVSALYLQGLSQMKIAAEVGVSQRCVSGDLKAIQEIWLASALQDFNALRAQQLAKIDQVEYEYWQAWQRSKEQSVRKMTEQKGETKHAQVTIEDSYGDPRFLQGIERCIDQRCKLLGLHAPVRTEMSGPNGGPIEVQTITEDQAIERYTEALHRAGARTIDVSGDDTSNG